jgi:hypothetical protein
MAVVPEGAQRSEDGCYWWDGAAWQDVPEDERTPAAGADGAGAASGEITMDELAQVTDPEHLTERTAPYFRPDPDMYADDNSRAETHDLLTDEPAHDAEGTV